MKMTFDRRKQLADRLLDCTTIQKSTNAIIDNLRLEIRQAITKKDRLDTYVISIIETCFNYPHGIEEFFNILAYYEKKSHAMLSLYKIIPEVWEFNSIIPNEDISQLLQIILQVPLTSVQLEESYNVIVSYGFEKPADNLTLLSTLQYLSNIPARNQRLPILDFLLRLSEKIQVQRVKADLTLWIKQTAKKYGYSNQIAKAKPQEKKRTVYLLVKLLPDPNNRNNKVQEFAVKIYAWRDTNDAPCIYPNGTCKLEEIPKEIDEAIYNAFQSGILNKMEDDIRAIEFILPCELISLNVEKLIREDFGFRTKLVYFYQIITRLDRDKLNPMTPIPETLRLLWKRRWKTFHDRKGSPFDDYVYWECNNTCKFNEMKDNILKLDNITCLFMTYLPQNFSDITELGKAIIISGLPVALWFKGQVDNIDKLDLIKQEMRQIVKDNSLINLPVLVHKKQKKAKQKDDLGSQIALLWDNPDRVPTDDEPPLSIN